MSEDWAWLQEIEIYGAVENPDLRKLISAVRWMKAALEFYSTAFDKGSDPYKSNAEYDRGSRARETLARLSKAPQEGEKETK